MRERAPFVSPNLEKMFVGPTQPRRRRPGVASNRPFRQCNAHTRPWKEKMLRRLPHRVRRSGQLGQHMPHQVRAKMYKDCASNTSAEIPRGTGNADKRIEGNHPDPGEGWNLIEPPKEEHRGGRV